jgi:hypothetical protein
MPDVPGTTLNSSPDWMNWLSQYYPTLTPQDMAQLSILSSKPTPTGGSLPLMAPPMVGHPVGLRDRESTILNRFGNG